MLRWTTPTLHAGRTAGQDLTLHGHHIRAGDVVTLWNASANRDERAFDEPDAFRLDRTPNRRLSFAYGSHFSWGRSWHGRRSARCWKTCGSGWARWRPRGPRSACTSTSWGAWPRCRSPGGPGDDAAAAVRPPGRRVDSRCRRRPSATRRRPRARARPAARQPRRLAGAARRGRWPPR
ncbi:cytochrome P450 [Streptomyces syringium]|uniref:cytochrome P450 n=1 Tax=Streptomyces syringium TaxID=76729 RepID=UPI0037D0C949